MKKIYIFILILLYAIVVIAQKHNNLWIHIAPGIDSSGSSTLDPPYPATFMDFSTSPPILTYAPTLYPGHGAKTLMCNTEGIPLFYSNGYNIYHFDGSLMSNGDSLAPIIFQNGYPFGYYPNMPLMSVPRPGSNEDYYIVMLYKEPNWTYTPKIMLSLITDAAESEMGAVKFKNQVLFQGHNLIDLFNMTKHANGQDWWILFSDIDIDNKKRTFHSIYLGKDTAYVANSQVIDGYESVPQHPWQIYTHQRIFSPNGEYFITLDQGHGVRIHQFDRCSGFLGPLITLPYELGKWIGGGIAIAPNSRYLYVSNTEYIFQYDLEATDIASTKDTVATYDGYLTPSGQPVSLGLCQLGPDGKIYYFTYGIKEVHYIEKPNEGGKICNVRQHAFEMPTGADGLPYYPNYRLGPLDGSLCDTLGLNNKPLADFWWFRDSTLTVEFADNSFYEPAEWHWEFGDGGISQDTNPVHSFPAPGVYPVCLTVSNQYAADSVCKQVKVGMTTGMTAPGLAEEQNVWVFPNPAGDFFQIRYRLKTAGCVLHLYDSTGRLVRSIPLPDKEGEIRAETLGLSAGFYFYHIQDVNGKGLNGKIVIEH